jgi:hypothetical protein
MQNTEALWKRLAELSAEALRMTEAEAGRFAANPVARLVGLLPFLAGCDDPTRTALAHLATWVVANRGGARTIFDHGPGDDREPLARLAPIADFRGGDKKVIDEGMRRLALSMVAGYDRDRDKDRALDQYNPLNAGVWNYEETVKKLGHTGPVPAAAAKTIAPGATGVDAVLSPQAAVTGVWDW